MKIKIPFERLKKLPKISLKKTLEKDPKKLLHHGLFWMGALLLAAGLITFAPSVISVSNTAGNRELPIYCVQTDEKKIALSFDAAWGNEDTHTLMDLLDKHDVKVTFFMTGQWVDKYPEDVKYIASKGHDLGNHSQSHPNMSQLSKKEIKQELEEVHKKVKELTGVDMDLFRPPYGDYNNDVILTAKSIGYNTIQWDIDTLVTEYTEG